MSRKRAHIGYKTKLAAAIGVLFLTYEERTKLSEDQILSLIQWDHDPMPHTFEGSDRHDNLTPMLIAAHRNKTAKVDIPMIAKTRRVSKKEQEFRARLLTPREDRTERKSSFKNGRKLQSRNTFKKKEKP